MKFKNEIKIFFWVVISLSVLFAIHEFNIWLSKKTQISLTCPYLDGKDVGKEEIPVNH